MKSKLQNEIKNGPLNEMAELLMVKDYEKLKANRGRANKNWVKSLLVMRGIRQKDIALKYGIAPSDLNRVIHGFAKTLHIRQKIATELGMTFGEVWGEKGQMG